VILHTNEGRKMLVGHEFKQTARGVTEVQQVAPEAIQTVLEREFGLVAG
jgi:hypothetical protein